jgi:hypothetical protein
MAFPSADLSRIVRCGMVNALIYINLQVFPADIGRVGVTYFTGAKAGRFPYPAPACRN